jgi:hypothetical protein
MTRGGRVKDADDLILNETQLLGAAPSVAIPEQHRLRGGARRRHFGLQQLRQRRAENILASGVACGQRVDRGGDPGGIEALAGFGLN